MPHPAKWPRVMRAFEKLGWPSVCRGGGVVSSLVIHFFPSSEQMYLEVLDPNWMLAVNSRLPAISSVKAWHPMAALTESRAPV